MASKRQRLLGCALLGLVAAGCGSESVELAGIVEREILELAAPISEEIVELPVAEGERVEAGQVVVQLDTEVGAAELRACEAADAAAQANLVEAEREFNRQTELRRTRVARMVLDMSRRQTWASRNYYVPVMPLSHFSGAIRPK